MIAYAYEQQNLKLKPLQIFVLALTIIADFLLIADAIASGLFEKWGNLALALSLLVVTQIIKFSTTFCNKKITFDFFEDTFTVQLIYPYFKKILIKCKINQINEMQCAFSYADNRLISENIKNGLTKMQNSCIVEFAKLNNITQYSKAFINGCPQDIYMLKLDDNRVWFVAIDEFMKSLINGYNNKISNM